MKNILLLFVALISMNSCFSQLPLGEYTSKNKKAIALYESAMKNYNYRKNALAKEELKKAIERDPLFVEPHLFLAELYAGENKIQQAIDEIVKALKINPTFEKKAYYRLAMFELRLGQYAVAKKDFDTFLSYKYTNPSFRAGAEKGLANCNFAIKAIENPVPFEPKNVGPGINSSLDEYFPAVTADNQLFLFTRNNRIGDNHLQEDFLVSQRADSIWQRSHLIGNKINTPGNEGAPTLSADGQLLFFTVCADIRGNWGADRKGVGACDIFYTQKVGAGWSKPYNLGRDVNTVYRETQPSFSADGKKLYFVSNRPGSLGKHDIYVTTLGDNGRWGRPVNLGDKVNSVGDEESVCISSDGKTLYFGSNGHIGMGGYDIYMSRLDENGKWGEPVNLGYPINTFGEEHSLLVNAAGEIAYFASNKKGGYGGLDIYQFELYEAAQPGDITYVKGKVYDATTKKPLGAHFELIDLATAKSVLISDANVGNGEFLVTLPIDKNYALNVSYPGYLFYSENYALKELTDKSKPFVMDVPLLSVLDSGVVVELKNVFFETAKFDLKPESKIELDKLVAFLNLNGTLRIELGGHTDNVGDKKMNLLLSKNRAKAVYDYLITNGIVQARLSYKGYGDTKPKVENDSAVNRAKNRRTEFKVIGN